MIKTAVLKKNKYSSKYLHAEEYALWFKLAEKYQLANLSEYLTNYRIHDSSVSQNNTKEQQANTSELICNELDKRGVQYSSEGLATIHLALNAEYGRRYFNTPEKMKSLNAWMQNVLMFMQEKYAYTK